jgi:hypothetical protein
MHYESRLRISISLAVMIITLAAVSTISSVPSVHAVPPNPITWAEKSPIPYRTAQAGVIGGLDGKIYVMGGYSSGSPNSTARAYDPRSDSWFTLTSMGTPTRGPGIAIDQNGLIYVISGFSGSGDITNVQVYSVSGNSWTSGTPIPTGVWMPGATTGKDGRIYVVGGEVGSTSSNLLQIYNSSASAWSSGLAMSTARKQFQAVAAPNGLIYAIGGMSSGGLPLATVEAYNITSNTWSAKASLPSAVLVFGATLGPDGLIYVFGGSTNYTNNNAPFFGTVYSYDPMANQWYNNTQALPTPRREVSAATSSYNGRMYVIGGANGTYLATNEEATVPASGPPPPPPPPPQPLVASITSITPNPAQLGQTVTFVGSGSDSDGDSIVAYHWRSSISGTIGTQATFTVNNLPAGTHNIYLSVQDNQGTWSPEAVATLTIGPSSTAFLGLSTFYWDLLALALVGMGVLIGYFVVFKKKKRGTSQAMVAPAVQGPASPQ